MYFGSDGLSLFNIVLILSPLAPGKFQGLGDGETPPDPAICTSATSWHSVSAYHVKALLYMSSAQDWLCDIIKCLSSVRRHRGRSSPRSEVACKSSIHSLVYDQYSHLYPGSWKFLFVFACVWCNSWSVSLVSLQWMLLCTVWSEIIDVQLAALTNCIVWICKILRLKWAVDIFCTIFIAFCFICWFPYTCMILL